MQLVLQTRVHTGGSSPPGTDRCSPWPGKGGRQSHRGGCGGSWNLLSSFPGEARRKPRPGTHQPRFSAPQPRVPDNTPTLTLPSGGAPAPRVPRRGRPRLGRPTRTHPRPASPPLPARRPLQPPAAVSAQPPPPGHCRPSHPGARGGRAGRGAAAASGNKAAAPLLLAGREGQRALSCSAPPSPPFPPSARHRHRHALTFTCAGPRGRRLGAHCFPHPKAGAGLGRGPPREVGAAGEGDSWAAQKSQVSSGNGREEAPSWLLNLQVPFTKESLRQPPRHRLLCTRARTHSYIHARAHTHTPAHAPRRTRQTTLCPNTCFSLES